MAQRSEPFAQDEWYHCYSRGVEKRRTFLHKPDYERFLKLLYLCNSVENIHLSDKIGHSLEEVLRTPRKTLYVGIGAFCLMPNHWHIVLKEKTQAGISTFLQKVGTAYAMYFNIKYQHVGGIFVKPFRSRHISTDKYFQRVVQYIHFNPAELFEREWKHGRVRNMRALENDLTNYAYSSLTSFLSETSPMRAILDSEVFQISDQGPLSLDLQEARAYYRDLVQSDARLVKASP